MAIEVQGYTNVDLVYHDPDQIWHLLTKMDSRQPFLCRQSSSAQGSEHQKMADRGNLPQQYYGQHQHRCGNRMKTFQNKVDLIGEQEKEKKKKIKIDALS